MCLSSFCLQDEVPGADPPPPAVMRSLSRRDALAFVRGVRRYGAASRAYEVRQQRHMMLVSNQLTWRQYISIGSGLPMQLVVASTWMPDCWSLVFSPYFLLSYPCTFTSQAFSDLGKSVEDLTRSQRLGLWHVLMDACMRAVQMSEADNQDPKV
jgi:hypothetical protein